MKAEFLFFNIFELSFEGYCIFNCFMGTYIIFNGVYVYL